MFCATVLYPNKEGRGFDFEHYATTPAPMYARFLGDNCVKFEVRKGLVWPGRPVPHFVCIASYWVRSREEYGASLGSAPFGVRVVCIRTLGNTDSRTIRDTWEAFNVPKDQAIARVANSTFLKVSASVSDTANAAVLVASDQARMLTGTVVNATAGATLD